MPRFFIAFCLLLGYTSQVSALVKGLVSERVSIVGPAQDCTNCNQLVCVPYSVKPATCSKKYIKFILPSEQSMFDAPWDYVETATTFSACSAAACAADANMFFYEDGVCYISKAIFTNPQEICESTCNDTMIYMVHYEGGGGDCTDGNIVIPNNCTYVLPGPCVNDLCVNYTTVICEDGSFKEVETSDSRGLQERSEIAPADKDYCFATGGIGTHDDQEKLCKALSKCGEEWKPCAPPKDDVADFLLELKDFKKCFVKPRLLIVDLEYQDNGNAPGAGLWLWGTGVIQSILSDWFAAAGYPKDATNGDKYGYMTNSELENKKKLKAPVCCYTVKINE